MIESRRSASLGSSTFLSSVGEEFQKCGALLQMTLGQFIGRVWNVSICSLSLHHESKTLRSTKNYDTYTSITKILKFSKQI